MPKSLSSPSTSAFTLDGHHGSVLLLHGFSGSPYEIKPLGEALHQAGFFCHAPLLPGHGKTPEVLSHFSAEAWVQAAKNAFLNLPKQKPHIVIGFSMGGLLATILATEFPSQIDKLILISPAFCLKKYGQLGIWIARLGVGKQYLIKKAFKGGDILDATSRKQNPNYDVISLKALAEFDKIVQLALQKISKVNCPMLALFGTHDRTVDPQKSAKILAQNLTTQPSIRYFDRSAHILPLDFERDEVCQQVVCFCESHE